MIAQSLQEFVKATIKISVKRTFTIEFSEAELKAIKHLIGKTSQYDRMGLGLPESEAILCGEIYRQLKEFVE